MAELTPVCKSQQALVTRFPLGKKTRNMTTIEWSLVGWGVERLNLGMGNLGMLFLAEKQSVYHCPANCCAVHRIAGQLALAKKWKHFTLRVWYATCIGDYDTTQPHSLEWEIDPNSIILKPIWCEVRGSTGRPCAYSSSTPSGQWDWLTCKKLDK